MVCNFFYVLKSFAVLLDIVSRLMFHMRHYFYALKI